jgi:hypothetical protein
VNGSGAREMMGLEGIIDDGTNVATFQGLTRTTYPELNGADHRLHGCGVGSDAVGRDLDYADAFAFERGNMGRPSAVLVNRSGQRSFWKNLKNDRTSTIRAARTRAASTARASRCSSAIAS